MDGGIWEDLVQSGTAQQGFISPDVYMTTAHSRQHICLGHQSKSVETMPPESDVDCT